MSTQDLPPLPEAAVKDMQSLRSMEPSASLVDRAMARLPEGSAVQTSRKNKDASRENDSKRRSLFIFMIPAVGIAVSAIFFAAGKVGEPQRKDMMRVEEKTLSLPESGNQWTSLDLQTQHHADEPAVVHIEVPTNVRVRLPATNGKDSETNERHCTERSCIHRFTQHHGHGVPVRIAVAHPGRYDIHVRHESKFAAMREHFVVTASRH